MGKRFFFIFSLAVFVAFGACAPWSFGLQPPLNVARGAGAIDVWWPTQNSVLTGTVPFKALLENEPLWQYQLFWQVDGGQWNWMPDNYADYPHKETSVDVSQWSWRGHGPYHVTFIATDPGGNIISQQAVDILVGEAEAPAVPATSMAWYTDPNSPAAQWAAENALADPAGARLMKKIAAQPVAQWFGGWNANVQSAVDEVVSRAALADQAPVLVAYNIPHRDCGSYSGGGAVNASAYRNWIQAFAGGIGGRKAWVILEPDALAGMDCLSAQDQQERLSLVQYAVSVLSANRNAVIYIDAGNANWIGSAVMAQRLRAAGIDGAAGFSLNISNFFSNQESMAYGEEVSALLGGKHFVVDSSRNGNGPTPDFQWCNPAGRALGAVPTTRTGNPLADAFLWIKNPVESDGPCNGGPAAGTFWPSYALQLAQNAGW